MTTPSSTNGVPQGTHIDQKQLQSVEREAFSGYSTVLAFLLGHTKPRYGRRRIREGLTHPERALLVDQLFDTSLGGIGDDWEAVLREIGWLDTDILRERLKQWIVANQPRRADDSPDNWPLGKYLRPNSNETQDLLTLWGVPTPKRVRTVADILGCSRKRARRALFAADGEQPLWLSELHLLARELGGVKLSAGGANWKRELCPKAA